MSLRRKTSLVLAVVAAMLAGAWWLSRPQPASVAPADALSVAHADAPASKPAVTGVSSAPMPTRPASTPRAAQAAPLPVAPALLPPAPPAAQAASSPVAPVVSAPTSVVPPVETAETLATDRMIAAHASLRAPAVADPNSVENRVVLQTMLSKALMRKEAPPPK